MRDHGASTTSRPRTVWPAHKKLRSGASPNQTGCAAEIERQRDSAGERHPNRKLAASRALVIACPPLVYCGIAIEATIPRIDTTRMRYRQSGTKSVAY